MNWTKHIQLTTTIHLTLMMTCQVVEMSVTTTDNSASQDYTYLNTIKLHYHMFPQIQIIYCNTKVNFQPNL